MFKLCRECKDLIPAEIWVQHQEAHRNDAKAPASERGYGSEHRKLRQYWSRMVVKGLVTCARCGLRIVPGEPWDLDHSDDRKSYRGPSHQACNRATMTHRAERDRPKRS